MECINCGREVVSNYCPNCGQRGGVKRINLREGWNDFWARIYGFDGFFPRTLRDLTLRPGVATKEFIRGSRMKYYGPVGYFFLMITLYLLVVDLLGVDFKKLLAENQNRFNFAQGGKGQQQFFQIIVTFISKNLKLIAFLAVPLDAIVSRFIFFRKSGFNYIENMILPFYLRGHVYWFSILAAVIFKFTGSHTFNSFIPFILIFFFGFGYSSWVEYQPKWKSFLKGIGVFFGSQVATIIVALLMLSAALLISPDFADLIRPSNNK